jgi:hypothetical protein
MHDGGEKIMLTFSHEAWIFMCGAWVGATVGVLIMAMVKVNK